MAAVVSRCQCVPFSVRSHYGHKGTIVEKERAASDVDEEGLEQLSEDYDRYYKYKHLDNNVFPESMKGLKFTSKLKYVQISLSTTTFDQIEKDRAAKFVDKLSAIGGTMGLLTGFSIISGVEIVYFIIKIVHNIVTEKLIQ